MTTRILRSLLVSIAALAAMQANATTIVNGNGLQNGLDDITSGSASGSIDCKPAELPRWKHFSVLAWVSASRLLIPLHFT